VAAFADEVLVKRRWGIRLGIAIIGLVTLVLLPVPRMILVGFVRGESFYKWKPTSYWSGVAKRFFGSRKGNARP
jgi:hypothetical protein